MLTKLRMDPKSSSSSARSSSAAAGGLGETWELLCFEREEGDFPLSESLLGLDCVLEELFDLEERGDLSLSFLDLDLELPGAPDDEVPPIVELDESRGADVLYEVADCVFESCRE